MAAPVNGAITRMPRVMVRPMPKPAMERKVPRSSTEVAKKTRTRKKDATASRSIAERREKSRTSSGVPSATARHVGGRAAALAEAGQGGIEDGAHLGGHAGEGEEGARAVAEEDARRGADRVVDGLGAFREAGHLPARRVQRGVGDGARGGELGVAARDEGE